MPLSDTPLHGTIIRYVLSLRGERTVADNDVGKHVFWMDKEQYLWVEKYS